MIGQKCFWLLALAVGLLASPQGFSRETTVLDLRKPFAEIRPRLRFFGNGTESMVSTDSQGLRIRMPTDRSSFGAVGVDLPARISGDFELIVGFELLSVGEVKENQTAGAGIYINLFFDAPNNVYAAMGRLRKPGIEEVAPLDSVLFRGEVYTASRIEPISKGKNKSDVIAVRAGHNKGKFQITRTGTVVFYAVSDGEGPFHPLRSIDFGQLDLKMIRLMGYQGEQPILVDVRYTELWLTTDQKMVWSEMESASRFTPIAPKESTIASNTETQLATTSPRSRIALIVFILLSLAAAVGGIMLWLGLIRPSIDVPHDEL